MAFSIQNTLHTFQKAKKMAIGQAEISFTSDSEKENQAGSIKSIY
jgi:hypothetical protein